MGIMEAHTDKWHKRLYNVEQAAEYLGMSPRSIYNGVRPGVEIKFPIPYKRDGRRIKFERADLDAYADGLPYEKAEE